MDEGGWLALLVTEAPDAEFVAHERQLAHQLGAPPARRWPRCASGRCSNSARSDAISCHGSCQARAGDLRRYMARIGHPHHDRSAMPMQVPAQGVGFGRVRSGSRWPRPSPFGLFTVPPCSGLLCAEGTAAHGLSETGRARGRISVPR
jgi:hypothetical protein